VVLSIAAVDLSRDLHLDAVRLGYLFSGFGWAYVAGQLPAGGLSPFRVSFRSCSEWRCRSQ
jgi:ACS family glucarate transporter-like MFS transporter